MNCPACGMPIDVDQRYAKLVVCAACQSAVVLDEKAARVAGKMAVLAPTPSELYVGAAGRLSGRSFTVRGRVRYGYERGYWDEWLLELDDGRQAWISEDESNLTLELHEELDDAPSGFATIQPGDQLTIRGKRYHVDEKDVAQCEGGEGQLPFVVVTGEKTPFLDLTGDETFATLEYDLDDDNARFFIGKRLNPADLSIDVPRAAAGAPVGERAGDADTRERVIRADDRARALNCNACGAPLTIPAGGAAEITCDHCGTRVDTSVRRVECTACHATVPIYGLRAAKTMVCPQCRAQFDISREEPTLLQVVAQADRPQVPFQLGQRGGIRGVDYVIVGHLRFCERDEGVSYYSDEFLLHAPNVGYRWLVLENGHYSLTEELTARPDGVNPRHVNPGSHFTFLDTRWRVFERGRCEIVWVDGELPWVAQVGDKNHYMDATAPPMLLSAEWTETEQEWYRATYLGRDEVAAGFGLKLRDLPRAHSIAPHQQFVRSPFRKQAMTIMTVAAIFFGAMTIYSFMAPARTAGAFTISPADYAEEYVTPSFEITEAGTLCAARFEAPVDNSWVYLDAAVLNEADEALLDFSAQVSYYHGVSGGESWSEGSTKDTVVFKLDEPGAYRLLVQGQAGTGETPQDTSRVGRPVTVTIRQGVMLTRYYLILAVVCLVWPFGELVARSSFESRKWAQSDVEDD